MADFFDKVRLAAQRQGITGVERNAREWFRKKVRSLSRGVTSKNLMNQGNTFHARPKIGNMYFYYYDPKHKDKLPYYDKFPLTIVIEQYRDGFLGLNLHYLSPKMRGVFMSKLLDLTSGNLDEKSKLEISYKFLKGAAKYKEFRPCVKRYLYSHMKSRAMKVEPLDWLPAVFLPVAQFKGKSKSGVWSDSRLKL